MSFLDTVKSLAKKAKCSVGSHAGVFKRIPGKPECYFEKTCLDCGKYIAMYHHKFGGWNYVMPLDCRQIRECSMCGSHEQREDHQYRVTEIDDRCNEQLECERCRATKRGGTKHSWDTWTRENDVATRMCKRCGKAESKRINS